MGLKDFFVGQNAQPVPNPMREAIEKSLLRLQDESPAVETTDIEAILKSVKKNFGEKAASILVNDGDSVTVSYTTTGRVAQYDFGDVNPLNTEDVLQAIEECGVSVDGIDWSLRGVSYEQQLSGTVKGGVLGDLPIIVTPMHVELTIDFVK